MKTYAIGVIGAGFMGRTHAYGWTVLPFFYDALGYRCVLKGVCTSRIETAEAARQTLGFERAYPDAETLISDPEIDVIDIASPNTFHKPAILAAAQAGKPIYCDKPLTGNLDDALEIERCLSDAARAGQMTLQYRFYPATLRARQMIEAGVIGDVICFRAVYLHSGNVTPGKRLAWKDLRVYGAGVLYDLGSHVVDLITWLCGAGLREVYAQQKTLHRRRPSYTDPNVLVEQDSDDMTLISATLTNGAIGSIEASKIATGTQDELRFEIHGTRGALRFNLMQPNYLDYFDVADLETPLGGMSGFKRIHCVQRYDPPAGFPTPKAAIGWLRGHVHCLYSFIDAVHAGRPFDPSLARGIELEKWLAAIAHSAQTHTPVAIP
ncbi:MAG: Gfo/Idh/MocA family oxidoreductase [Anaerolineae bacterium]|nr:Gfo/Idh/MocA family oxidoreductase [Thermoflexales bacterium]MDW8407068.1 Gfo/Idh/MocA family oxidoreductase [Anaerolineae bacterium]